MISILLYINQTTDCLFPISPGTNNTFKISWFVCLINMYSVYTRDYSIIHEAHLTTLRGNIIYTIEHNILSFQL